MSALMATGYHCPPMTDHCTMFVSPRMLQLFLRVLKARHAIVGVFILLTPAGTYGATQIPTDTSINRLIVASDPVAQATREFERVFPEGEQALIVLEPPDPLSAAALQSADQLQRDLGNIPLGSPWLDAWLEKQTGVSTKKFMALFGVFLMTLVFIVYRSWRALAAIILTLGAVVAIAVGLGDVLGWSNSVVSTLVPLTVMVTTTATLVYIHSRYMEPDGSVPPLEHHARALAHKFLPCTA